METVMFKNDFADRIGNVVILVSAGVFGVMATLNIGLPLLMLMH